MQTFFRRITDKTGGEGGDAEGGTTAAGSDEPASADSHAEDEDEDEEEARRGAKHREYVKECLLAHPIWQDGNFWEQALWKCTIEQVISSPTHSSRECSRNSLGQLQTIPYEKDWHEMDKQTRLLAVRRVHDVIFSQVMAIIHSMMELGCSQKQTREFLYRMCVIHQLSEVQRLQLLDHTLRARS